jgi:hypothetical protein
MGKAVVGLIGPPISHIKGQITEIAALSSGASPLAPQLHSGQF